MAMKLVESPHHRVVAYAVFELKMSTYVRIMIELNFNLGQTMKSK